MQKETQPIAWRRPVWLAALVVASIGLSLGFACAVPLAGFAAVAALTMPRRAALLLIIAVVIANQCVGFTLLHYPRTPDTFAWGGAFLLVGVLAVLAAGWVEDHAAVLHPLAAYAAAFLAAFAAYEGGFFLISLVSSSALEAYAAPIVLRIFAINAMAFVGLLVASQVAASVGLAEAPARGLRMTHRPV